MNGDLPQNDGELDSQLLKIVVEEGMVDPSRITLDASLDELGIKSADFVMILMAIEEKFSIYLSVDGELAEAKTVRELLGIIKRHIRESAIGTGS